jgi:hypothetical protein
MCACMCVCLHVCMDVFRYVCVKNELLKRRGGMHTHGPGPRRGGPGPRRGGPASGSASGRRHVSRWNEHAARAHQLGQHLRRRRRRISCPRRGGASAPVHRGVVEKGAMCLREKGRWYSWASCQQNTSLQRRAKGRIRFRVAYDGHGF